MCCGWIPGSPVECYRVGPGAPSTGISPTVRGTSPAADSTQSLPGRLSFSEQRLPPSAAPQSAVSKTGVSLYAYAVDKPPQNRSVATLMRRLLPPQSTDETVHAIFLQDECVRTIASYIYDERNLGFDFYEITKGASSSSCFKKIQDLVAKYYIPRVTRCMYPQWDVSRITLDLLASHFPAIEVLHLNARNLCNSDFRVFQRWPNLRELVLHHCVKITTTAILVLKGPALQSVTLNEAHQIATQEAAAGGAVDIFRSKNKSHCQFLFNGWVCEGHAPVMQALVDGVTTLSLYDPHGITGTKAN